MTKDERRKTNGERFFARRSIKIALGVLLVSVSVIAMLYQRVDARARGSRAPRRYDYRAGLPCGRTNAHRRR